ncbi:DUF5590 domain-containing protein [Sporolactobacillus sp. Y61]|uniref:DUF5590 domain-containing protein n=1 Tax=Sporolactobacillus sp. Y61 TaxID=3160863 RepID=A0AAU8IDE2_9BACL
MKNWIIAGILCILVLPVLGFYQIYSHNMNDLDHAAGTAAEKAKQQYGIQNVLSVTYYHGSDAYQVVNGTRNGRRIYVWVPDQPKQADFIVRGANKGITEKQALHTLSDMKLDVKKIQSVRLGAIHNQPVWMITFLNSRNNYNYVAIYFDNGKEAQRILNV